MTQLVNERAIASGKVPGSVITHVADFTGPPAADANRGDQRVANAVDIGMGQVMRERLHLNIRLGPVLTAAVNDPISNGHLAIAGVKEIAGSLFEGPGKLLSVGDRGFPFNGNQQVQQDQRALCLHCEQLLPVGECYFISDSISLGIPTPIGQECAISPIPAGCIG